MFKKAWRVLGSSVLVACCPLSGWAQKGVIMDEGFGQVVQLSAQLDYFRGEASWLVIIRDVDHGMNIPYLLNLYPGTNFLAAFTFSHDYMITASQLTLVRYVPQFNAYRKYVINDFCHLQSGGRIHRGKSVSVSVVGKLSPHPYTYNCSIAIYPEDEFTVVE